VSHTQDIYAILLTLGFATAAGLVGSFALMKRMVLAGDVISHVALPGIGVALLFHFNPLLGGAISLLLGTLLIAQLQQRTGLATDAMIGVVFAGSLALGAAITPQEDLEGALFGSFAQLSSFGFIVGLIAVLFIIGFIFHSKDQLVLGLFSSELAAANGVPLDSLNLQFLLIFSLTVLIGLKFMGALLAGALIMLPAAIGRRLSSDLKGFLLISSMSSVFAVGMGLLLCAYFGPHIALGPATTLVAAVLFGLALLRRVD